MFRALRPLLLSLFQLAARSQWHVQLCTVVGDILRDCVIERLLFLLAAAAFGSHSCVDMPRCRQLFTVDFIPSAALYGELCSPCMHCMLFAFRFVHQEGHVLHVAS